MHSVPLRTRRLLKWRHDDAVMTLGSLDNGRVLSFGIEIEAWAWVIKFAFYFTLLWRGGGTLPIRYVSLTIVLIGREYMG